MEGVFVANPVRPAQFCDAIPASNADLCTKFTKWLSIPSLLCDLFSWMFDSDGSVSQEFQAQTAVFSTPTGALMYFATQDVGDGWLLCDGREISRTTYAALFAKLGTLYGAGDGSTTFALPDGRNRSLISVGSSYGFTTKYVGEATHTMTVNELVPHTHTWDGPTSRNEEHGDGANNVWKNLDPTAVTGSTGGGAPFNVVHPCLIAFLHIKT